MTKAEAIAMALSEETGEPIEKFLDLMSVAMEKPEGAMLDKELSDEEAAKLFSAARNNPAGVWEWLFPGWASTTKNCGTC